MATLKADAMNYRDLREELSPLLGRLLRDMSELDSQMARARFGASVDPQLAQDVDTGVREVLKSLESLVEPEDLMTHAQVVS